MTLNFWDIFIGILIAGAVAAAIFVLHRSKKHGSSCCGGGCSGDCSSCTAGCGKHRSK